MRKALVGAIVVCGCLAATAPAFADWDDGPGAIAGGIIGGAIASGLGFGYGYGYDAGPYYYDSGPYYGGGYYGGGGYYSAPVYQGRSVSVGPAGASVGYCESHFRSYNPATGTYLGYDGRYHPCP